MLDYSALLMAGYGTAKELKRQEGESNAVAGLVNGNPNAIGDLARYNPKAALGYQQSQQEMQLKQREQQQKLLEQGKKAVGQAALQIATLPPEQRAAAWDKQIDYLVGQGWTGLSQFKGRYSDQNLMGVISESGLSNELRQATQPSYQVVPEGGTLVNTRDPASLAQFGQPQAAAPAPPAQTGASFATTPDALRMVQSMGPQAFLQWQQQHGTPVEVTSPQELAALPPGTHVRSPDGRMGIKK